MVQEEVHLVATQEQQVGVVCTSVVVVHLEKLHSYWGSSTGEQRPAALSKRREAKKQKLS